jgi:thioredoxin-like negative regulator of GroEL
VTEQIKIIDTKNLKGRLLLLAMIIAGLVFAWFSVSWQLGNMFGSLTSPNDPNARPIADFAHSISPHDPMTNFFRASVEKGVFTPESLDKAIADLEEAIRNAPEDYRFWIELGRAHEQTENYEKAEKAFQRAVAIAPHYSNVHWYLGNFYLRRGREEEAFAELRRAADASAVYSEQVFSIVWDYYDKDKSKVDQLAGERGEIRANLARFYAAKGLPEDSLRIWNTISEEDKQRNQSVARVITQALYEKRNYRSAVEFVRQLGLEPEARAETIQNAGFETPIADATESFFGWKVNKKEKIDVNTDLMRKKEGTKSLRLTFNGFTGIEVKNVYQIVPIEANKKYRLSFWLKTENLRSAGTPTLEIVNANDDKFITASAAFPGGTQDWTLTSFDFSTPPNAEAVALRIDRVYCGDACPIVGVFWVDDFKLEKIN